MAEPNSAMDVDANCYDMPKDAVKEDLIAQRILKPRSMQQVSPRNRVPNAVSGHKTVSRNRLWNAVSGAETAYGTRFRENKKISKKLKNDREKQQASSAVTQFMPLTMPRVGLLAKTTAVVPVYVT